MSYVAHFLEREQPLAAAQALLRDAKSGHGRLVLVAGEAGIGKTTFVHNFAASASGALVLKGHCDPLFTPAPLAPLHDMAPKLGSGVVNLLADDANRGTLFLGVLQAIQASARPVVMVIEDIHWADDATLDFLKFLARRLESIRLLAMVTYRSDEVPRLGNLRTLLGQIAGSEAVQRIELSRLGIDSVRTMAAGIAENANAIHARTLGNPLFVAELLGAYPDSLPETVKDVVLARLTRLNPEARNAVEFASVIGARIDPVFMANIAGASTDTINACIESGLLSAEPNNLAFRHELVRVAVLESIDPLRRRRLFQDVLAAAMVMGGHAPSQLVHYAEGANDVAAILKFGSLAAESALKLGANREAAAHYRLVLDNLGDEQSTRRAEALMGYARASELIDSQAESASAREEAANIWRCLGDARKTGEALSLRAWPLVRNGQNEAAEKTCAEAIAILEGIEPSRELGSAYRVAAHLRMLDRDRSSAERLGGKAIALATQFGDAHVLTAAEIVVGTAILVSGDLTGRALIDRAMERAGSHEFHDLKALALLNTGSSYGELYLFPEAERDLLAGLAFARNHDFDVYENYMLAWLALVRLHQGKWDEAGELALRVIATPNVAATSKVMALAGLGRLRARRGDSNWREALDDGLALAEHSGTLQRIAPIRCARSEAYLLADGSGQAAHESQASFESAMTARHAWHVGEMSYWQMRCGLEPKLHDWIAEPFAHHLAGDWQAAALAWEQRGCPYEQARALAEGDLAAKLLALEIFNRLGAAPAAAALRRNLRGTGAAKIPRGPRESTKRNAHGLTHKELAVLPLLAKALTNAEIARELRISPKTVDHHVSAILSKLGAANRREASRLAEKEGLLSQT